MSPESGGRRRGGAAGGSGGAFGGGSGCIGGAVPGGCSENGSAAPFLAEGAGRMDAPVADGFSSGRFSRSGDSVAPTAPLAWVAGSGCSGKSSAAPFLAEGAGRLVAPVAGGFSSGRFSRSGDSVAPTVSLAREAELGAAGSSEAVQVGRTAGPTGAGLSGAGDFRSERTSVLSAAADALAAGSQGGNAPSAMSDEEGNHVMWSVEAGRADSGPLGSPGGAVAALIPASFFAVGNVSKVFWMLAEVYRQRVVDAFGRTGAGGMDFCREAAVEISLPGSVVHMDEHPHAMHGGVKDATGNGGGHAASGVGSDPSATGLDRNISVECPHGARSFAAESPAAHCCNSSWIQPSIVYSEAEDWAQMLPDRAAMDDEAIDCSRDKLVLASDAIIWDWSVLFVVAVEHSRDVRLARGDGDASPRPD